MPLVVALVLVCVVLPSAAKVHRTFGGFGLLAYAAGLLLGARALEVLAPRFARMRTRTACAVFVLVLAGVAAAFVVVHPHVTAGSDRDEALDAAARALLDRRYPYGADVFPAPVSPMPGELVLAAPFVLLFGSAAWQTFLWIAAFFAIAVDALRSAGRALLLVLALVALAPIVLHEIVTGGDLLANACWVLVFAVVAVEGQNWAGTWGAVMLGVGLSSRAPFVGLLPIVFVAAAGRWGRLEALGRLALTAAVTLLVTAPFVRVPFAPLHSAGDLAQLGPWALPMIAAAWAASSVAGATWAADRGADPVACLAAAAWTLAAPAAAAAGFALREGGAGFDRWAFYALAALPFGSLAAALQLLAASLSRRIVDE